jgi:GxxExxY protein
MRFYFGSFSLNFFAFNFLLNRPMPIKPSLLLRPINQEEFGSLDYHVMRHAFDSHNELGRLCDEQIYQNDLAARLESARLGPIRTEVPVEVTHGSFTKTYYLDLVVQDTAIYELKTAVSLLGEHESQLLNYLLLHEAHHGKLVNFRPLQVESRFVNTGLTIDRRRSQAFNMSRWQEREPTSKAIHEILVELLTDWGGFLEISLYAEAITHFLGGEGKVLQKVPLFRNGLRLGDQCIHLAAPDIAFRLTALTEDVEAYERELRSLFEHTSLRMLHWINLAHHKVDLVTLTR